MEKSLLSLCLAFVVSVVSAEQAFVLSSSGDGITVYKANAETGELSEIQTVPDWEFMAITKDQRRVFAIGAKEIATYDVEDDGKLKLVGKAGMTVSRFRNPRLMSRSSSGLILPSSPRTMTICSFRRPAPTRSSS